MPDKTFIKITNRNIYDAIEAQKITNTKEHAEIIKHQQQTNGKVKLNRWMVSTALMIALAIGLKLIVI